jgi:integrase
MPAELAAPPLLQDFFDSVYRPLRLRGRSPNTCRLYGCTIRTLGKHLQRPATISDVGDELLLASFLEARSAAGMSPFSVEKERGQLMALARFAFERRVNPVMPSCPPTPLPERIPESWTPEDMARLMRAAEQMPGTVGGVLESAFWPALLAVCYDSGERIGAIMQCRQADLRGNVLTVRAETRKGRRADRVVSLSPATIKRVEAMRSPGCDLLFSWPKAATYLWDRLHSILAAAGLSGRRIGFQQVRRTGASFLAAAGEVATGYLGHAVGSGDKVARRWYVDPRLTPQRPAWELLPPIGPPERPSGAGRA